MLFRSHGVDVRVGVADEADAAREAEAATELEFDGEDSDGT